MPRKRPLDAFTQKCAICGDLAGPLLRVHVLPRALGGSRGPENLMWVCANCNFAVDRGQLREFEFVNYLAQVMRLSPEFRHVRTEAVAGPDLGVDVAAEERTANGWRPVLIECKVLSVVTGNRFSEVLVDLDRYRKALPGSRVALAIPAVLAEPEKVELAKLGVETWDLPVLAAMFASHARKTDHPYLRRLLLGYRAAGPTSPEHLLADDLKNCPAGRDHWSLYQRLVGRIFERLFCPPLTSPIGERPDRAKVNRRDWIFPNYAASGMWAFWRGQYHADFIVIDAKNYTGHVKKKDALQVANYLKEHGAGLLGFIVCRGGADDGCLHTLREEWIHMRKLVIVLTDGDILKMLEAKRTGTAPEAVIQQAIENFRLGL